MKKLRVLFATAIILLVACQEQDQVFDQDKINFRSITVAPHEHETYYWYNDEQIPLIYLKNKYYVVTDLTDASQLARILPINKNQIERIGSFRREGKKYMTFVAKNIHAAFLLRHQNVSYIGLFYKSWKNPIGLSITFTVQLKSASDLPLLEEFARENKVEIIGNSEFSPLFYTLSCDKFSRGNSLQMANKAYETGNFESAEPSFIGAYRTN